MPTRRDLLAATGLAAAGATAGCLGLGGDGGEGDGDGDGDGSNSGRAQAAENPDTVRLQELSVQNNHDEAHQVQLAVEADDDVLHLDNYELESAGGSRTLEGDWNSEAGSYRIHARLDDGEIRSTDVTEGIPESASCVKVLVRIDGGGGLDIWNGADCEA